MGNSVTKIFCSRTYSVEDTPTLTDLSKNNNENHSLPEGTTLVWLDSNAGSCNSTQQILLNIHSQVMFFDKIEPFCRLMRMVHDQRSMIILVVSGRWFQLLKSELSTFTIINSLLIFCNHPERYETLSEEYSSKSISVVSNHDQLRSRLEIEFSQYETQAPTLNFFTQEKCAIRDLTFDEASFVWFQLTQRILMETHYQKEDMMEMLDFCRRQYRRNIKQKTFFSDINEFESSYSPDQACQWYSRETFVYKLINNALRTENIDALYIFRFYISDLCRELAQRAKIWRKEILNQNESPIITVYRGTRMSRSEIEKLQEMKMRGIMSINGFVSTSRQQWVAELFMNRRKVNRKDTEKVLWIIEFDIRNDEIVCAYLGSNSSHLTEEEVLFNIGSVFRIDQVEKNQETAIWHIKATATNRADHVIDEYMELIRRELNETSVEVILGILLIDMGKYETAKNYFERMIKHKKCNQDLVPVYYNLGLIHSYQKELAQAEAYFLQAIDLQHECKENPKAMIRLHNALGLIYQVNGELNEALEFYRISASICRDQLDDNDLANAQTYTNLGQYYQIKSQYQESIDSYQRALDILRTHVGEEHQRVGILHNEIGDLQRRNNHLNNALASYRTAETIFLRRLPRYHPCLAYCWSSMGIYYLQIKDRNKAREYHQKALDIYKRVLPANHNNISISEKNLNTERFEFLFEDYIQICAQV